MRVRIVELVEQSFEHADQSTLVGRVHRLRAKYFPGLIPVGPLQFEIRVVLVDEVPERVEVLNALVAGFVSVREGGRENTRRAQHRSEKHAPTFLSASYFAIS